FVVHVNVRQILDSELVKKHAPAELKTELRKSAELQALLASFGVDPLKDISSITLAGQSKKGLKQPLKPDTALTIIRGGFDPDKIPEAASDHAQKNPPWLPTHKLKHGPLYEAPADKSKDHIFATFLGKEAVVFGTRQAVLDAVSRNANTKPAAINKDLQALIS